MYKKFLFFSIILTFFSFLFSGQSISAEVAADIEISRDASTSSIGTTVMAGGGVSDFNIIKIENKSANNIRIDWMKISRSGGTDNDFANVYIYLKNADSTKTQLSSGQSFSEGVAFFNNIALTVPSASSKYIIASASLLASVADGTVLGLSFDNADNMGVTKLSGIGSPVISGTVAVASRTVKNNTADKTAPGAPSSGKAESVGTSPAFKISWTDPSDTDLLRIDLYRSTVQNQEGVLLKTFNRGLSVVPENFYTDSNLSYETTYYYTLKAVDMAGNQSTATIISGIVYNKGLTIKLNSTSPAAANINASSTDNVLASFDFFASNLEAELTNLNISGDNFDQIKVMSLYNSDVFIASTTGSVFSFYSGLYSKLAFALNETKTLKFKADIPLGATGGAGVILKIFSISAKEPNGSSMNVYGLGAQGNKMTIVSTVVSPSPSPLVLPSPSVSPSPSPSPSLVPSNLLSGSDGKVYKIIGNKKIWIPSAVAFNIQGLKWENIQKVADSQISQYVRIKLLQAIGDLKVYYITESGLKRHIISAEIFNSYGNKWEDIIQVSATDVNSYGNNVLVKVEGDAKVYKLENGQKRWIKTAEAFNKLKLDWTQIAPVNAAELGAYMEGIVIQ